MTSTGPFSWDGSSKIQFFTGIWHLFCWRLLRPAYVTFLKTGCKYQNAMTSAIHRTHYIYEIINPETCQSKITLPISIWDTLYISGWLWYAYIMCVFIAWFVGPFWLCKYFILREIIKIICILCIINCIYVMLLLIWVVAGTYTNGHLIFLSSKPFWSIFL